MEQTRPTLRTPDFFIVGAPKCGTTAMQDYLRQHPDIFMPERKEPHFFGSDLRSAAFLRDPERYAALFADATAEKRVGEASVWYLYSKVAAGEIKAFRPDAQIIIMLRNPADMLYSQHSQFLYNGNEDITGFAEALAAEDDRRAGQRVPATVMLVEGLYYRETVRYAPQVQRYFDAFGRENVHVILFDDFTRDTAETYRRALRFLGVDDTFKARLEIVNPNKRVRSKRVRNFVRTPPHWARRIARWCIPNTNLRDRLRRWIGQRNRREVPRAPLDSDLRNRLLDEFASDTHQLSRLLGRDLDAWSATWD